MYKVVELTEIKHHKNMNNVYDMEFRIEVNNDELDYPHYGKEMHTVSKSKVEILEFIAYVLKLFTPHKIKEKNMKGSQKLHPEFTVEIDNATKDKVAELKQWLNPQNFLKAYFMRKFKHQQNKEVGSTMSIGGNTANEKIQNYRIYLCQLIQIMNMNERNKKIWIQPSVAGFFEISMFNFYKEYNSQKILKQGFIWKKSGGRFVRNQCIQCFSWCTQSYSLKWFILTDQFLCYVSTPFPQAIVKDEDGNVVDESYKNNQNYQKGKELPFIKDEPSQNSSQKNSDRIDKQRNENGKSYKWEEYFQITEVLLIDSQWEMKFRHRMRRYLLKIKTNNRILNLKFKGLIIEQAKIWKEMIIYSMQNSPWSMKLERVIEGSFAPLRRGNKVKIMIDGEMYFRNLAEELKNAQNEIFICDWWLCAKLYLVRPINLNNEKDNDQFRLDQLLLQAAKRGVNIYIVVWRESRFGAAFDSLQTKQYLTSLHPNIHMLRHPQVPISMWSHHTKLVCIDQSIVFMGGLDICYGRWDMQTHPLMDTKQLHRDLDEKEVQQMAVQEINDQVYFYPGQDFCNERQAPLENDQDHTYCSLNREKQVRMPFHDLGICIQGDTATDFAHYFVHLWNNAKLDKYGRNNKYAEPSITTHKTMRTMVQKVFHPQLGGEQQGISEESKEVLEQSLEVNSKDYQDKQFKLEEGFENSQFNQELEDILNKNNSISQFQLKNNMMDTNIKQKQQLDLQSNASNQEYFNKLGTIMLGLKQDSQTISQPSRNRRRSTKLEDEDEQNSSCCFVSMLKSKKKPSKPLRKVNKGDQPLETIIEEERQPKEELPFEKDRRRPSIIATEELLNQSAGSQKHQVFINKKMEEQQKKYQQNSLIIEELKEEYRDNSNYSSCQHYNNVKSNQQSSQKQNEPVYRSNNPESIDEEEGEVLKQDYDFDDGDLIVGEEKYEHDPERVISFIDAHQYQSQFNLQNKQKQQKDEKDSEHSNEKEEKNQFRQPRVESRMIMRKTEVKNLVSDIIQNVKDMDQRQGNEIEEVPEDSNELGFSEINQLVEDHKLMNVESRMEFKLTSNKDIIAQKRVGKKGTSPYMKTEEIQIILHNPPQLNQQDNQDMDVIVRLGVLKDKKDIIQANQNEVERFGQGNIPDHTDKSKMRLEFQGLKIIKQDQLDTMFYQDCQVQALRSASKWSMGLLKVEHSIYEAYITLIEQAQKFIYIENQFFVTNSCTSEENKKNNSVIKNKIGLALRERIVRAHKKGEDFLVLMFFPATPAFYGDVNESSANTLRIQIGYQQSSISRGEFSLIKLLKKDGIPDPYKYIKVFCLRNHGLTPGNGLPTTEMIYIHSKLMIVDDQYIILGSANINDRSMLGSRDAEIAVLLSQQEEKDQKLMKWGNRDMYVSRIAHKYRTELMMEHFDLSYKDVADPISNYELFKKISEKNTEIYEQVLNCEPGNNIKNFKELLMVREVKEKKEKEKKEEYIAEYQERKKEIQGHAVDYPEKFLIEENLNERFLYKEMLVPEIVFV